MYYMIYISTAVELMSEQELSFLLKQSTENNSKRGITGMLLYKGGVFMQMLEGEKQIVLDLYKKIQWNKSHKNPTIILSGEIKKRYFKNWSMGFRNMDKQGNLPNYSEYIQKNVNLNAFKEANEEAFEFITLFDQINN